MSTFKLIPGRLQRDMLIARPDQMQGHLKFNIPEFYGVTDGRPFAVSQVLNWAHAGENGLAEFTLDVLPSEIGIDYHGSLTERDPGALCLETYVANAFQTPIEEAHHTIHLDMSTMSDFQDDPGQRTFVYTNTGWVSLAELCKPLEAPPVSLWVGATYGELTVIWRVIARVSEQSPLVIGFAMDRAYALASDHPDWPKGLLVGCRWGTLTADEEQMVRGRIYFCDGGLEELRERYAQDFRPPS